MVRRPVLTAVLMLAFAAAPAHAADPLLSGYAGPGGGEQVVLGSTTPKSGGGGGSSAPASRKSADDTPLAAAPPSSPRESESAGSTLTRTPQRKKSSPSTSKDTGTDDHPTTTTTPKTTATATLPGAPAVVAYPTRAGEVGGLPLSAPALLLVVLGAAAATLLGLGLRRLTTSDRSSDPQVSA